MSVDGRKRLLQSAVGQLYRTAVISFSTGFHGATRDILPFLKTQSLLILF